MEKFTKGEWIIHQSQSYVTIEGEFGTHIYDRGIYESTVIEQMANAHLIAAAPDMYKMLERIKDSGQMCGSFVINIDKLLTKARGE